MNIELVTEDGPRVDRVEYDLELELLRAGEDLPNVHVVVLLVI